MNGTPAGPVRPPGPLAFCFHSRKDPARTGTVLLSCLKKIDAS